MTIPTKTYKHSAASAALFFKNKDDYGTIHQAIRVEIPEIGKEFTDNAYIGKGAFSFTYVQLRYFMVFCFGIMKIPTASSTTMQSPTSGEMSRPKFSKSL
jgi:hypothetical protein